MRLMASLQPKGLLAFRLSLPLVGLSVLVRRREHPPRITTLPSRHKTLRVGKRQRDHQETRVESPSRDDLIVIQVSNNNVASGLTV